MSICLLGGIFVLSVSLCSHADVPVAEQGVNAVERILRSGNVREQQSAIRLLGSSKDKTSASLLLQLMNSLLAGQAKAELELEILEAASRSDSPHMRFLIKQYEQARPAGPLGRYRESLYGGDAMSGYKIFFGRTDLNCFSCHRIHCQGGDVGPDLSEFGRNRSRNYLLESIINPSGAIADGYDALVTMWLDSGLILTGIVVKHTATEIHLFTSGNETLTIDKGKVIAKHESSPMPSFEGAVTKSELRDLIEYLSNL